jgi:type II secretory pathway component PulF
VTRLVDIKQEQVYRPASTNVTSYHRNYNSYFTHAQTQMSKPGSMVTQSVVLLETNLYEVKNKELVWSMSSDTVETNSIQQLMKSVSKSVRATLKKDKLI